MKKGSNLFTNAELCTQCGYCLPVCPTYRVENNELHSPRGRVSVLLALQTNHLTLGEAVSALDHCLVCQACHAACPVGVRPGKLAIKLRAMAPQKQTLFRRLFHYICSHAPLTSRLSALLALYQRSPLQRLVRRWGLLRPFPGLDRLERLIPLHRPNEPLLSLKTTTPTRAVKRVGLLTGCMARLFFPNVAPSSAQLLASLGYHVLILENFGCCGAPYRESGERKQALRQAQRTLDAFLAVGPLDAMVCDSSICVVTAQSYRHILVKDATYAMAAQEFSDKAETLSQFLAKAEWPYAAIDPGFGSLTYQDHCQTRYGLGIIEEPRSLLKGLPVDYRSLVSTNLSSQNGCCGTGGDYMLRHPERSQTIMHDTLSAIRASGTDTVVGENPGCLLNIASGLEQSHTPLRVRHLAEILWAAYRPKPL